MIWAPSRPFCVRSRAHVSFWREPEARERVRRGGKLGFSFFVMMKARALRRGKLLSSEDLDA